MRCYFLYNKNVEFFFYIIEFLLVFGSIRYNNLFRINLMLWIFFYVIRVFLNGLFYWNIKVKKKIVKMFKEKIEKIVLNVF